LEVINEEIEALQYTLEPHEFSKF